MDEPFLVVARTAISLMVSIMLNYSNGQHRKKRSLELDPPSYSTYSSTSHRARTTLIRCPVPSIEGDLATSATVKIQETGHSSGKRCTTVASARRPRRESYESERHSCLATERHRRWPRSTAPTSRVASHRVRSVPHEPFGSLYPLHAMNDWPLYDRRPDGYP